MKLILHIGTEKTGTTSVQHWLANNYTQLLKDGILYSQSLGRPDNRKISVFARDPDKPDDGFERFNILSPQEHESFCLDVERLLKEEVLQAKKLGINYFIISSEHLHSRLTSFEMVKRLKNLLLPLFDEVEILCYLRPQASLLQSFISVKLRQLSSDQSVLDHYIIDENYYNYYDLWTRWTSSFQNVKLRAFNRYKDVVVDICRMVSVDLSLYPQRVRTNKRLDYRTGILSYSMSEFSARRRIEKSFLRIFMNDLPMVEPLQISRSLASDINKRYHESNTRLVATVDDLSIEDLEVDLELLPEEGNAEKMFNYSVANDFYGLILARTNFELQLERSLRRVVEAERALCRGRIKNAEQFIGEAIRLLSTVERSSLEEDFFSSIRSQSELVKCKIEKIVSEIEQKIS